MILANECPIDGDILICSSFLLNFQNLIRFNEDGKMIKSQFAQKWPK